MSNDPPDVAQDGGGLKQPETGSKSLEIWMDGECRICTGSRVWCEERDPSGRLHFTDFRTAGDSEIPVSRSELENSMWVREGDGRLLEGFSAWRRILSEMPGWRWLSMVSGWPPLCWFGPPVYRLIARNRHRWSSRR
jgi:predicted DCC family thiol-disulfide oxidoreductase YuxK